MVTAFDKIKKLCLIFSSLEVNHGFKRLIYSINIMNVGPTFSVLFLFLTILT